MRVRRISLIDSHVVVWPSDSLCTTPVLIRHTPPRDVWAPSASKRIIALALQLLLIYKPRQHKLIRQRRSLVIAHYSLAFHSWIRLHVGMYLSMFLEEAHFGFKAKPRSMVKMTQPSAMVLQEQYVSSWNQDIWYKYFIYILKSFLRPSCPAD